MEQKTSNKFSMLLNDKKVIVFFFLRLSLLFSIWFFVYSLFLKPPRYIDKPVTDVISAGVVKSLNFFIDDDSKVSWTNELTPAGGNALMQFDKKVIGIYDVCNGVDLMFIYISILFLLPFSLVRKIVFSIVGIVVITLANILRVCLLYYIYIHYQNAFDFSHHYLFTILMYLLIFYGWILFTRTKPTA
jgi:exosortase/archaeosortase family protein